MKESKKEREKEEQVRDGKSTGTGVFIALLISRFIECGQIAII